jgi:hypothetical protein
MEIERVKAMKAAAERENAIKAQRRKKAGEIKDQIYERETQKLLDGTLLAYS